MPVEVVLRDVEHRGAAARATSSSPAGSSTIRAPRRRAAGRDRARRQRIERGRRHVAGDRDAAACARAQPADELRDGRLAVRARDRDDLRRVAAFGFQRGQRAREQLDLAATSMRATRRREQQGACGARLRSEAGAEATGRRRRAARRRRRRDERRRRRRARPLRRRRRACRRRGRARRRGRHQRAIAARTRRGRARGSCVARGRRCRTGLSFIVAVFNVDRPTSTSIIVTIQNRTTTCVSFQPPSSKW